MSTEEAIRPLQQTLNALRDIRKHLQPYLREMDMHQQQIALIYRDNVQRQQRAEAEAAVALALGTLQFMNARLNGSDCSKTDNPLRIELARIRKSLVSLQQLNLHVMGNSNATDKIILEERARGSDDSDKNVPEAAKVAIDSEKLSTITQNETGNTMEIGGNKKRSLVVRNTRNTDNDGSPRKRST